MTTVTAKELRIKFPEISRRIFSGESFVLIYNSKPLCEMVPFTKKKNKKTLPVSVFEKLSFLQEIYQSDDEVCVSQIVILEVFNVLCRKGVAKERIISGIYDFFGEDGCLVLSINGAIMESFFKYASCVFLKTADLLLLVQAKDGADVLVTWDKVLLREGKKMMECRTPQK